MDHPYIASTYPDPAFTECSLVKAEDQSMTTQPRWGKIVGRLIRDLKSQLHRLTESGMYGQLTPTDPTG